jgi:hypothetical protein
MDPEDRELKGAWASESLALECVFSRFSEKCIQKPTMIRAWLAALRPLFTGHFAF